MASTNGKSAILEKGLLLPALAEDQVSSGGDAFIEMGQPYRCRVRVKGVAPLLMHRYNVEAVEEKGKAAKGSTAKKTDNVESYAYRTDDGYLGIDGLMFAACIREAGRSEPDPRSPRKSMRDLLKSIVIPVETTAPFQPLTKEWDYLDRARVVVQRSAVTRTRPAMGKGWECLFTLDITSSDYLPAAMLRKLIVNAGRFNGLADFRPTYGRFDMIGFELVSYDD